MDKQLNDNDWSDATHSRVFKMSASRFATELIFRYAWIWILSLSVLAVIGVAVGFVVDLRWLIVALMVIFLFIPAALAFLYYFYGLKRECYVNTIPHRIVITDEGLVMRLLIPLVEESRLAEAASDDSGDNKIRFRDELFPFGKLNRFVIGKDSAIVPIRKPDSGFIWIPADAFADSSHLTNLLKLLDDKIKNN